MPAQASQLSGLCSLPFPPPRAARLAADVAGTPTVLIARTDAHSANLLTSDIDDADKPFCTGKRTPEGFFYVNCGVKVRGQSVWFLLCLPCLVLERAL